jgi:glucose-6-phosphate 1-dehydrogenase
MAVQKRAPKRTAIVIFGASGDLTSRKIVPALHSLMCAGLIPKSTQIIGVARSKLTDDAFRDRLSKGMAKNSRLLPGVKKQWPSAAANLSYLAGDYDDPKTYRLLAAKLSDSGKGSGNVNHLFYLSTPPQLFPIIVKQLGRSGLARPGSAWTRIIIEKPFGRDRKGARTLNGQLHAVFSEGQVYRIDHYLGKETVQNIVSLRFANSIFEPLWNRNYVDHVQITMAENIGVEHRAGYYDHAGVLRDMVQNHVLQLLSLTAMEPPSSFDAQSLWAEKVKVLKAVRRPQESDVAWGQYWGYLKEKGVSRDSKTPTFVALKLYVDNWRWHGVPFYLRTGKMLPRKATEIGLKFKSVPLMLFPESKDVSPNRISLCIQPDEGVDLRFETKVPGMGMKIAPADLVFHYNRFSKGVLPEAYERLLLDAIHGDPTLFVRNDFEDRSWAILDPLLNGSENADVDAPHPYKAGSWGPTEADQFMARDGRSWELGCSADSHGLA